MEESALLTCLMAEVAALRTELEHQKSEVALLRKSAQAANSHTNTQAGSLVPTSRRRLIKKLAAGVFAGVATSAIAASSKSAEARIIARANPGAVIVPNGTTVTGSVTAPGTFGLIASCDNTLNLSNIPQIPSKGILGYTADGDGVYGLSNSSSLGTGVFGANTSTGIGVYGFSQAGYGLYARSLSSDNAQLRLDPASKAVGAPGAGSPQVGDIYLDSEGQLFVYTNIGGTPAWKQVQYL